MFSVVTTNQGFLPISHTQLMSRCAGAGSKLANENIPHHRCHAQLMAGAGWGGRRLSAFCFSRGFLNSFLAGSLNFFGGGCELVIRW